MGFCRSGWSARGQSPGRKLGSLPAQWTLRMGKRTFLNFLGSCSPRGTGIKCVAQHPTSSHCKCRDCSLPCEGLRGMRPGSVSAELTWGEGGSVKPWMAVLRIH